MMDPLPTIAKVFSYVVQQECHIFNCNLIGNLSFETKNTMINVASSTLTWPCSYCGKYEHTVEHAIKRMDFLLLEVVEAKEC